MKTAQNIFALKEQILEFGDAHTGINEKVLCIRLQATFARRLWSAKQCRRVCKTMAKNTVMRHMRPIQTLANRSDFQCHQVQVEQGTSIPTSPIARL
jgi:hypothetical protein